LDMQKKAVLGGGTPKTAEFEGQVSFPIDGRPFTADCTRIDSNDGHVTSATRRKAESVQDSDTGEPAEETFAHVKDWVRDNQDAVLAFASSLKHDVKAKRRASTYKAVENMRAKCYLNAEGEPTKTANAYTPYLGRMFVADFPEAGRFMHFARSKADKVSLCGIASLLDPEHKRQYLDMDA
jgi:polyphosphate kinase 2 (PPK2 family)